MTVDLTDGTYDAVLFAGDFARGGSVPAGVTIAGAARVDANTARLTLDYDGTDLETIRVLTVTVAQSALASGREAESARCGHRALD